MTGNLEQTFEDKIQEFLKGNVETIKERILTEATDKFRRELRQFLTTYTINVSHYYSVKTMGGELIFTIYDQEKGVKK